MRKCEKFSDDCQWCHELVSNGIAHNSTLEELYGVYLEDESLSYDLDYYLRFNRGGRKLLRQEQEDVPAGLWAHVLARSSDDVDVIYYFLQNKPDLIQRHEGLKSKPSQRRKRRRQN